MNAIRSSMTQVSSHGIGPSFADATCYPCPRIVPLPMCPDRTSAPPSPKGRGRNNKRPPFRSAVGLPELVGNFLDASLGARLVAGLVVAAHADAADRVIADIDRIAAAQRNDFGELPLAGSVLARLGAVAPLERRATESA